MTSLARLRGVFWNPSQTTVTCPGATPRSGEPWLTAIRGLVPRLAMAPLSSCRGGPNELPALLDVTMTMSFESKLVSLRPVGITQSVDHATYTLPERGSPGMAASGSFWLYGLPCESVSTVAAGSLTLLSTAIIGSTASL